MSRSNRGDIPDSPAFNPDTGPHRVELKEWISCAPFESSLGIHIQEADQGRAVLKMPFTYIYANGAGMLHGGAMSTLADTAAVFALKSLLPRGTHFATTHMEIDFIRPVFQGWVSAIARVSHASERTWNAEVSLYDEAEHEVMRMQAIFRIARRQPGLTRAQAQEISPEISAGK
jgi:uncharacterized protein (TIGR00369 family)